MTFAAARPRRHCPFTGRSQPLLSRFLRASEARYHRQASKLRPQLVRAQDLSAAGGRGQGRSAPFSRPSGPHGCSFQRSDPLRPVTRSRSVQASVSTVIYPPRLGGISYEQTAKEIMASSLRSPCRRTGRAPYSRNQERPLSVTGIASLHTERDTGRRSRVFSDFASLSASVPFSGRSRQDPGLLSRPRCSLVLSLSSQHRLACFASC
jgi:hypothetical protein